MKVYIAVLDEFPDYMTPTLVAHTILRANDEFRNELAWKLWKKGSFKKCVVRVNQKEFDRIASLPTRVCLGHENTTLEGKKSCAVVLPYLDSEPLPNVLKFAKLWSPKK